MRLIHLAALIAVTLHSTAFALEWHEPRALPSLSFETLDQRPANLSDLTGNIVLVNFWATWCAPCKKEMPHLGALQEILDDKNFEVIAIALDSASNERIEKFLEDTSASNLTIWRDPKRTSMREYKIAGLPASFILDKEGQVIATHFGYEEWNSEDIVKAITAEIERP